MKIKESSIGIIFCFLASFCWSTNGVLVKSIDWSAMSLNSIGNFLGMIPMIIYMIATRHKFVVNKSVILGGSIIFITNLSNVYANKLTTAANTVALQFTMPIFIIAAMWIFFHQKPKKLDVITSIIVMGGIMLFVVDGLAVGNWLGNLIALICGIGCAGVYMQEVLPNNDSISAFIFGKILCFAAGIPSVISENALSGKGYGALLIYGLVSCGIAFILLPIGLKYASPVSASLLSSAEPLFTPLWMMMFYPSEKVTATAWAGFIIVMVSLIVYNAIKAKEQG